MGIKLSTVDRVSLIQVYYTAFDKKKIKIDCIADRRSSSIWPDAKSQGTVHVYSTLYPWQWMPPTNWSASLYEFVMSWHRPSKGNILTIEKVKFLIDIPQGYDLIPITGDSACIFNTLSMKSMALASLRLRIRHDIIMPLLRKAALFRSDLCLSVLVLLRVKNLLNDILFSGPNIYSDLFVILLDFRLFKIGISTEEKMNFLIGVPQGYDLIPITGRHRRWSVLV